MYQELPAQTAGITVWRHTAPTDPPGGGHRHPVLPDGCIDLIWTGHDLLVAGPDTRATTAATVSGQVTTGIRFAPGTGAAAIGLCAAEVRDRRIPLAAVWPDRQVRELVERIAEAGDPAVQLELLAGRRLRECRSFGPVVPAVVDQARANVPVARIADEVGVSPRQLHRICLSAFGYGAKTLARILRIQRALTLARRGVRFAEVAAAVGYADQAHLAREVRALAGVPLGHLVGLPSGPAFPTGPAAGPARRLTAGSWPAAPAAPRR